MRVLFDTSVLVAASLADHAHHAASLQQVEKVLLGQVKGYVAAHSLAEFYATLTALPIVPPVSPVQAREIIEGRLMASFEVVDLSADDYRRAIRRMAERNLRSGAIYDALLIEAAIKKKITQLLTWNLRDFERIADEGIKIQAP